MTRRVMTGRWDEVFPACIGLPGTTRTGRQRAMAAVLVGGADVGDLAHDCGSVVAARRGAVDELHLTRAAHDSASARTEFVLHHSRVAAASDLVAVDGIRCTSATRTIIDCAALLDDEALEAAFEQARRMGLTTPAALARRGR